MAFECARSSAAYTSAVAFLVVINFVLQGCDNGSPSAFMNGVCESWCDGDQYTVENGRSHKDRHCGTGDMSAQCGGCPHCGGSNHDNDNNHDNHDNGNNNGDGDCCTNCAGRAHCSPQSFQCHDEKPWNKQYYLDCGGTNHDDGNNDGGDACEDWCENDQYRVENGRSHKARHCGTGDMSDHCGGCPYCDGTSHDDGKNHDNGNNNGDDDCCNHCAGHPHCSPQSGQCHDEKPLNKDYYFDCGGSGSDSGGSMPRRRRRRISGGSSGGKGGVAVNSDYVNTAGNWLDGKLRWAHGWYPSQNYNTPSGVTFIPQFAQTHEFSQSVPSDATYVLCFNEPNEGHLHGAQGMSVSDAVGLFKKLRAKTQAKIILGNFAVTKTMETWYKDFKNACSGCHWEAVGIHPYDAYPMSHVERIRKYADGKEIWLTEWNAGSGNHAALIRQTVPTLEKDTQIGGYLWFSQNAPISGDIAAAFNEVL